MIASKKTIQKIYKCDFTSCKTNYKFCLTFLKQIDFQFIV